MARVVELMVQAGIPKGVFQMVQGDVVAVNALCDHPEIAALTFVGSSKVAELVEARCHASSNRKRCIALGGAKNHMIAMPDANVDMTAADVTASFTGTAGQRCMAATVLVTVGQADVLVKAVAEKAGGLKPGQGPGEIGPVI